MNPYRTPSPGPPLLRMWYFGNPPPIGAPLYLLRSGSKGNGAVKLYNSWRTYLDEGLSELTIHARLTLEADLTFPRAMMEVNRRVYQGLDRMLAIMGLTSHRLGVGDVPYVRVGTYQGMAEGRVLVRPDPYPLATV